MTPTDLRVARVRLHLTQAELATILGVDRLTISRWERGKNRIPKMAEMLLTTMQEVYGTERVPG